MTTTFIYRNISSFLFRKSWWNGCVRESRRDREPPTYDILREPYFFVLLPRDYYTATFHPHSRPASETARLVYSADCRLTAFPVWPTADSTELKTSVVIYSSDAYTLFLPASHLQYSRGISAVSLKHSCISTFEIHKQSGLSKVNM